MITNEEAVQMCEEFLKELRANRKDILGAAIENQLGVDLSYRIQALDVVLGLAKKYVAVRGYM